MNEVIEKTSDRLELSLLEARTPKERALLLEHATDANGPCDADYCPWNTFKVDLCIRRKKHEINCRCPDCCPMRSWRRRKRPYARRQAVPVVAQIGGGV